MITADTTRNIDLDQFVRCPWGNKYPTRFVCRVFFEPNGRHHHPDGIHLY